MRNILTLCMTLVMGLLIAQHSPVNSRHPELKKLNKFTESEKQTIESKTNRDFPGKDWFSFHEAWEIYGSNSGDYGWSMLWPDSIVKYVYEDGGPQEFFWYLHSVGQVLDPASEVFGEGYDAEEWFDGEKSYVIDSVRIRYAYFRYVDSIADNQGNMSAVVDTLVINIVKDAGVGKSSLVDGNGNFLCQAPIVGYTYTENEPSSGTKIRIEKLLTNADTTGGDYLYADLGGYLLEDGDLLAATISYRPGTQYQYGDTLFYDEAGLGGTCKNPAGNQYWISFYEEVLDDLPVSHTLDDNGAFNQGLIQFTDGRYNQNGGWNGDYVPSFAYSSPTFGIEHMNFDFFMEPFGVDFYYNKTGLSVDFYDNSNFGPTTWKWSFDDGTGNQMGGQNITYLFPAPGTYEVCLEANNGTDYYSACQDLSVSFGLGVEDVTNKLQFSLYPNPTKESLTLNFKAENAENAEITMFDILGNEVYTKSLGSIKIHSEQIDVSNLAEGLYILKVMHGTHNINKNISVVK